MYIVWKKSGVNASKKLLGAAATHARLAAATTAAPDAAADVRASLAILH